MSFAISVPMTITSHGYPSAWLSILHRKLALYSMPPAESDIPHLCFSSHCRHASVNTSENASPSACQKVFLPDSDRK